MPPRASKPQGSAPEVVGSILKQLYPQHVEPQGLGIQASFSIQFTFYHFQVHVFLIVMNTVVKLIVLWLVYYI